MNFNEANNSPPSIGGGDRGGMRVRTLEKIPLIKGARGLAKYMINKIFAINNVLKSFYISLTYYIYQIK